MPIPLRSDFDAAQLRGVARRTKDAPQARRLLALAAIYEGATRTQAAAIGGWEQAHQSAMDHHVCRPPRLGIPVLIIGTWYQYNVKALARVTTRARRAP